MATVEGEVRTVRRMVKDALADGEARTTGEILAIVKEEDPRCRSRNYLYAVLSRLTSEGTVIKEIRASAGKGKNTVKTEAFWRLGVA